MYDNNLNLKIAVRTTPCHGLLYKFSLLYSPCSPSPSLPSETSLDTTMNSYARFGYPGRDIVNDLVKKFPFYGDTIKLQLEEYIRSLKQTSSISFSAVKAPLELVHSTVCGPFPEAGLEDELYFVVFVDEYTHMKKVFALSIEMIYLNVYAHISLRLRNSFIQMVTSRWFFVLIILVNICHPRCRAFLNSLNWNCPPVYCSAL